MTEKFPLFRLPHVALYEVLDYIGLDTIIPLSLCSKRVKSIMKDYHGPSRPRKINLNPVNYTLSVNLRIVLAVKAVTKLSENLKEVTIGPHKVPIDIDKEGVWRTYWMDKKEGMEALVKYMSEIFNREIYSIRTAGIVTSDELRFWIKFLEKFQGKIYMLTVLLDDDDWHHELIRYILESDFVTGELLLSAIDLSGFEGPPPRRYSIEVLRLKPSYWVTLDHLLAMDIKRIALNSSSLTCQDINVFLKKWINGECSERIKQLFVDMENEVNFDKLTEGIEVTRRNPNLRRDYIMGNGVRQISGGLDIKRTHDGRMATIVNMPTEREKLNVFFWPDLEGNPYH